MIEKADMLTEKMKNLVKDDVIYKTIEYDESMLIGDI